MTPARYERIARMLQHRRPDMGLVLENVKDQHNLYAILRTAEATGVGEVHIIHTMKSLSWEIGKRTSGTAIKWLNVTFYSTVDECMSTIQPRYQHILGTYLHGEATDLYDTDLTGSVALVLGHERKGISTEMLPYLTGNIQIPIMGIMESLNVSVAAAVILYEAVRQRKRAGQYDRPRLTEQQLSDQMQRWVDPPKTTP